MKIIKNIFFTILFISSTLLFNTNKLNASTDDDLMAKEYENFMSEFNNLPEEDKKMIEELANQIETMVKEEGLDPSNPDDLLKWMEKQEALENMDLNPKIENKEVEKKTLEKPLENKENYEDLDSLIKMLKELNKLLSLFRQKVAVNFFMNEDITDFNSDLNLFTYFLHVMENKDITKYLLNKEFEKLKSNLESFHNTLLQNQDLNLEEETEEDNPYHILGLNTGADLKEIEQAYNELKSLYDPEILKNNLTKENYSEKDVTKKLKRAKLTFSFIQNAYDSLKDPKEKNLIDKNLLEKEKIEKRLEKRSLEAFQKIKKNISNLLPDILKDIKNLFEKYKPEEIAKAKAYEEAEKKILAESKKNQIIPSVLPTVKEKPNKDENEEFWRNIQREQQIKQYEQINFEHQKEMEAKKAYEELFKPKKQDPENKTEEKVSKKSDSGKKSESKKPESKKVEAKKPENKKVKKEETKSTPKEVGKNLIEVKNLDNLLSDLKDSIEIQEAKLKDPSAPQTPDNIETKEVKLQLIDILKDLDKYLKEVPLRNEPKNKALIDSQKKVIVNIKNYFEKNKVKEIWELLKKISSNIKERLKDKDEVKELKELIKKYEKHITDICNKIYNVLNLKLNNKINPRKANFYGLSISENSVRDPEKDTKINLAHKRNLNYLEDVNLAKYRKYVHDIKNYFHDISSKLKD